MPSQIHSCIGYKFKPSHGPKQIYYQAGCFAEVPKSPCILFQCMPELHFDVLSTLSMVQRPYQEMVRSQWLTIPLSSCCSRQLYAQHSCTCHYSESASKQTDLMINLYKIRIHLFTTSRSPL